MDKIDIDDDFGIPRWIVSSSKANAHGSNMVTELMFLLLPFILSLLSSAMLDANRAMDAPPKECPTSAAPLEGSMDSNT
eukprot:scaffold11022_cov69-Cylindrotheca_fusiformis.AAC.1